jgi:hypothetical protein
LTKKESPVTPSLDALGRRAGFTYLVKWEQHLARLRQLPDNVINKHCLIESAAEMIARIKAGN